ncbi:MAG: hypothetical protein QOI78_4838, partial [Actinomycetota bacterium]|nr:hypothetical protein [Actinomycetota bacterium]
AGGARLVGGLDRRRRLLIPGAGGGGTPPPPRGFQPYPVSVERQTA